MIELTRVRNDENPQPEDLDWILPQVSVIIPTLNEAANLPYVLPRIPLSVGEIVVVDGHSKDNTAAVAPKLHPKVRVLFQTGRGKGDALRCGFAEAEGDIIVTMDADGSMRPEEMPRFLTPLCDGYDFAKGSRFKGDGGSSDMDKHRTFGNKVLALMTNLLHGTRYTDVTYGYNAFLSSFLSRVNIDGPGFTIETDTAIKFKQAGARIIEVPSFEDARINGTGKLNSFRDGWSIFQVIVRDVFYG